MPSLRRRSTAPIPLVTPVVSMPIAQRNWLTTAQAAAVLSISERSLRRRIHRPHWIEGRHWRRVTRQSRQTLEINIPAVVSLMDEHGWS